MLPGETVHTEECVGMCTHSTDNVTGYNVHPATAETHNLSSSGGYRQAEKLEANK